MYEINEVLKRRYLERYKSWKAAGECNDTDAEKRAFSVMSELTAIFAEANAMDRNAAKETLNDYVFDAINTKAKPCPFCGNEAHIYHSGSESNGFFSEVICNKCGCRTKRMRDDCAIETWNKRTDKKKTARTAER